MQQQGGDGLAPGERVEQLADGGALDGLHVDVGGEELRGAAAHLAREVLAAPAVEVVVELVHAGLAELVVGGEAGGGLHPADGVGQHRGAVRAEVGDHAPDDGDDPQEEDVLRHGLDEGQDPRHVVDPERRGVDVAPALVEPVPPRDPVVRRGRGGGAVLLGDGAGAAQDELAHEAGAQRAERRGGEVLRGHGVGQQVVGGWSQHGVAASRRA